MVFLRSTSSLATVTVPLSLKQDVLKVQLIKEEHTTIIRTIAVAQSGSKKRPSHIRRRHPTAPDQSRVHHSPSTGETLPSAVRTKCVILVFLAFLFWLPTSISILVLPWTSGHIMATGVHDLAFEAESSVESLCATTVKKIFRGTNENPMSFSPLSFFFQY